MSMFNYNPKSIDFRNTTIPWYGMDSEESYIRNLKDKLALLKQHDWINKSVVYSFNSNGFRCNEFTSNPTVMFLGCSNTFGTGLPIDAIWPELVAKSLNMKCANLAQVGGSLDTAFRMCLGYIDKIKPKIIFLLNPYGIRWEMVSKNNIDFFGIWTIPKAYKNYMQEYVIDENNNYFNTCKNILAIESLCKERQIKFLNFEPGDLVRSDLARDLSHPGVQSNLRFANTVLSKLEIPGPHRHRRRRAALQGAQRYLGGG